MTNLRKEMFDIVSGASRTLVEAFMQSDDAGLDPEAREAICRGTLLNMPASGAQIAHSEMVLGVALPLDYRAFLEISDGMAMPLLNGHVGRLLRASELNYLRNVGSELLDFWADCRSGQPSAPLQVMPETIDAFVESMPDATLLRSAIAISEIDSGSAIVICPFKDFGADVFETWEIDAWGGVSRYRSFRVFIERALGRACAEWSGSLRNAHQ